MLPGATDSKFYAQLGATCYGFAPVRLDPKMRARVDPSDVVQEAQLEASRRLDDYLKEPALPFRLWLRQIAYDRLLMLRRHHVGAARRTVERDLPLPDRSSLVLVQQLVAAGSGPSQQLIKREFVRRVREAVNQSRSRSRTRKCARPRSRRFSRRC